MTQARETRRMPEGDGHGQATDTTDELVEGARRLRPDDHFMILSETDASPMHIGAMLLVEAAGADFVARMRRHLRERLPHTPLLARLVAAPDGYDSDLWANIPTPADADLAQVVERPGGWTEPALRKWIASASMTRLDLSGPPFGVTLLPGLGGGRAAIYLKVHHAVTDGIGFQTILRLLGDETAPFSAERPIPDLPDPASWRALADRRFAALEGASAAHRDRRAQALAGLEALKRDPATARARTPALKRSGPTSAERAYATLSLPLPRVKAVAKALGGTINDLFLALAGTALRDLLLELDDLPDTPLVANSARSYRRPEHGDFGNRIVALHPHIATHLGDPLERLRAIQAAMAGERLRTALDEAMLDQPERPFGPRDRRAKFAERTQDGRQLLPGNVSLSNVPGSAQPLTWAGHAVAANYPVPIIGSGRFLNITSRRNEDRLDLGIMADPTRVPDVERIAELLRAALATYTALAA